MANVKHEIYTELEKRQIRVYSCIDARELEIIQPHLMPQNIKSAFLWLIPYRTGDYPDRNVSLYSVSRDYHVFSSALKAELSPRLEQIYPGESFYFFCDSSPINEVAAAVKCGLGVYGNNRLLINPIYGSYVFIGSVLTTLPYDESFAVNYTGEKKRCLMCKKCFAECDFLSGKRCFCYSELNQRKNVTEQELCIIKSRKIRWGCDDCQEVCPMNAKAEPTPIEFFYKDTQPNIDQEYINSLTKPEFRSRAYSWRGKKVILRNISK